METKTNILFTGVMSALVSCVDEDGNVYERSMRRLMNDQMKAGLNGFLSLRWNGEGPVLQKKKTRMEIAEIAKDEVKNGGSLIAHVGAIDLTTAVELARHAGRIGLDAISSVPPFFFHYGEAEIADYYKGAVGRFRSAGSNVCVPAVRCQYHLGHGRPVYGHPQHDRPQVDKL